MWEFYRPRRQTEEKKVEFWVYVVHARGSRRHLLEVVGLSFSSTASSFSWFMTRLNFLAAVLVRILIAHLFDGLGLGVGRASRPRIFSR